MFYGMMNQFYQLSGPMMFGLILISIWSLIWEGLGLWHSAQNKQKGWFLAILILNTLGLLPIIYLIWFKQKEKTEAKAAVKKITVKKKKRR